MKRTAQYVVLAFYIIAYAAAFIVAYAMTKNDPDMLSASLSFIASSMLFTSLITAILITSKSNSERFAEYLEEKEKSKDDDHSS